MRHSSPKWSAAPLTSVATVKARLGWKGLKAGEYQTKGYIFLSTPNLKHPRIDFDDVNYINEWRYNESPEIQLQVGDVLLVKDGSTLGVANLVRSLPGPATVNGSIAVLRPTERVDPNYLHQYVLGREFQELVRLKKGGLGVPHLFQADLREFIVRLPPVSEQRKIAEVLDTVDEAIRKTEAIIAKLKQVKQGLLHDLLTRGIDDNGELRDPDRHPEQFKDSPLGPIPKAWTARTLGELLADLYRYPTYYGIDYVENGVPEVRGELLQEDGDIAADWRQYRMISEATAARFPRVRLQRGDFVMSVRGTLGKICIVPQRLAGAVITANLIKLTLDEKKLLAEWARQYFLADPFQSALELASSATTIKTIQVPALCAIRIPLPHLDEQAAIGTHLGAIDARIRGERDSLAKLRCAKRGLMDDLLTGRVRVTDLLDKDPAA